MEKEKSKLFESNKGEPRYTIILTVYDNVQQIEVTVPSQDSPLPSTQEVIGVLEHQKHCLSFRLMNANYEKYTTAKTQDDGE